MWGERVAEGLSSLDGPADLPVGIVLVTNMEEDLDHPRPL